MDDEKKKNTDTTFTKPGYLTSEESPENKEAKKLAELKERIALCTDISEEDVIHALEALVKNIPVGTGDGWNLPRQYFGLVTKMLPFITKNCHALFAEDMRRYHERAKADEGESREIIVTLFKKMQEEKAMKGITIAEIGGTFTKPFIEALGGEGVIADAGRRVNKRDSIITMSNYKNFFPDENGYDVVCTNSVFDDSSGFEEAVRYGGANKAQIDMIEHDLVKDGGAVINHVNMFNAAYWQSNWEEVMQHHRLNNSGLNFQGDPAETLKFIADHPKNVTRMEPLDNLETITVK